MGDQVVSLAQRRVQVSNDKDAWTPREMLRSLLDERMPNGVLVLFLDEDGLVQIRRSKLDDQHELWCIRTAAQRLLGLSGD